MTQPLPSETIEYERYVDGLRRENAALKHSLKAAIHNCKQHNAEYHHLTVPEQLVEWEALVDNSASQKTITVHVEGGLVQDVTGIPPGVEVRVEDYDEGDRSHPLWDAEKGCFVTVYGGDGV
ncbi:MAG TPA: hypothetical protein VHW09_27285 [Bryobacteraceae bacterium]|jgi:hypothetical protein|nr:hypothetical protein [Bryobacteraceae bacterium]